MSNDNNYPYDVKSNFDTNIVKNVKHKPYIGPPPKRTTVTPAKPVTSVKRERKLILPEIPAKKSQPNYVVSKMSQLSITQSVNDVDTI